MRRYTSASKVLHSGYSISGMLLNDNGRFSYVFQDEKRRYVEAIARKKIRLDRLAFPVENSGFVVNNHNLT